MVQKRIIPCLLLHKNGLYKTERFKKPTYIGDPLNAIKIFNDKEVDELIVLDIDATVRLHEPNYQLIEDMASECFMPLCYGGGIQTIEQMQTIYALGIEKISISSMAVEKPSLIEEASSMFGAQSVIVTIDVKKDLWGRQRVFTHNGKKNRKLEPIQFAQYVEQLGAGEIVINSIDLDGKMQGFDMELLSQIKANTSVPIVALGGAGSLEDIQNVFEYSHVDAVSCGSLFVYQGPLKGVLINYPSYETIQKLIGRSL